MYNENAETNTSDHSDDSLENNLLNGTLDDRSPEHVQLVTFEVKQQLFGIDVSRVQEVIRFESIIETPGSLDLIEGVIDLRGNIIPVIDLRKRFKMNRLDDKTRQRIIIVESQDYIFGFVVDKVNEVYTFNVSEFELPPPGVSAPGSEYTVGMVHKEDALLLFLDIEKVLDLDQLLKEL